MPHSSGGGSSSGGSHGGSGGSFVPRVSNTYLQGYHRFVVYDKNRPRYFYSNREAIKRSDTRLTVWDILFWMIYPLLFLLSVIPGLSVPEKMPLNYPQTEIVIQDNTDQLTGMEEGKLREIFQQFQAKTGITPTLITFPNSQWRESTPSFEKFAFNTYVSSFQDESHWLLCYSSDPGAADGDWYWEGMQGNDTDPILTERITNSFTKNVQRCLKDREHYTVGESFIQGFRDIEPMLMKRSISSEQIWVGILMVVIAVVGPVITWRKKRKLAGLEGALRCPSDTFPVTENTCSACGGVYVRGIHTVCPYCGTPIPQENEDREPEA
ncbi:MAG: hypothetical protein J5947_01465 [Clostridium sp.]|nr:hypothetical protein [Clostridium sp.]